MNKKFQMKKEVLRYLGHRGQKIDDRLNKFIEETIDEIKTLIKEKYIYQYFHILRKKEGLCLKEANLCLRGNDIKNHLFKSKKCILMAATLGHDVDTKIRYYEKTDMTKALILDACATAFIEEFCDRICREIQSDLRKRDKALTSRFSPGYGDLSIDIQKNFLSTLNTQKSIGLNVSSNSILIPRKSVTAIVGVIDIKEKKEKNNCINCNKYSTCKFSKGGNNCEH